ncbi:MAG: hypothetical protein WC054_00205 [Candidatus Nanopelagicales bacterium]
MDRHAQVVESNRANPVDPDDVDEVSRQITRWENSQSKTLTLSEYLGWTEARLKRWLIDYDRDGFEEAYWSGGAGAMHWAPPPSVVEPFEKLIDDLTIEYMSAGHSQERREFLSEMKNRLKTALDQARALSDPALVR